MGWQCPLSKAEGTSEGERLKMIEGLSANVDMTRLAKAEAESSQLGKPRHWMVGLVRRTYAVDEGSLSMNHSLFLASEHLFTERVPEFDGQEPI